MRVGLVIPNTWEGAVVSVRTLPREGNLRRIVIGQGFGVGGHECSLLQFAAIANQRLIWRTIERRVRASWIAWPWMSLLK